MLFWWSSISIGIRLNFILLSFFQTKSNPNERSNNNTAADSSAEDDSDDDGEQTGEQKENPRETHGEVSIDS